MKISEFTFIDDDGSKMVERLISTYEEITGRTLNPADPERLFISWIASILIQERVNINYIGNQNIPSRASGKNLDALGEWIFNLKRKSAAPSRCTIRFTISEAQTTSILIPSGTRITDMSNVLTWHTVNDALIPIGDTYIDVIAECNTPGAAGNGYAAGQINTLIDVDNVMYFADCSNIEMSDGGYDEWDDDTYYEMLKESLASYSVAGSKNAYIYWAKTASADIADVKAVSPIITRTEQLQVYSDGTNNIAFLGGDNLIISSLKVFEHGGTVAKEKDNDYSITYEDGLLMIYIDDEGSLLGDTVIDIEIKQDLAGRVKLYALMNDGSIASSTIKNSIYSICSSETVRPLTDYVSVEDPEYANYNITLTYYIPTDTKKSISEIQADVEAAVNEYIAWQCAKLGRDINPFILYSKLIDTGIKRVNITSPTFTVLRSGEHDVPQVAKVGTITLTNGGYEDE